MKSKFSMFIFLLFQLSCDNSYYNIGEVNNFNKQIISQKVFVDSMRQKIMPVLDTVFLHEKICLNKELNDNDEYKYRVRKLERSVENNQRYLFFYLFSVKDMFDKRQNDEAFLYTGSEKGYIRLLNYTTTHLVDSVAYWANDSSDYNTFFKKIVGQSLLQMPNYRNPSNKFDKSIISFNVLLIVFFNKIEDRIERIKAENCQIPKNAFWEDEYFGQNIVNNIISCWFVEVLKSNDSKLQIENGFIHKIRKKEVVRNIETYYKTTEHYQTTLNTLQDKSTNAFSCAGLNGKSITNGFTWSETESAYIVSWPIMKIETKHQIALKNILKSLKEDSEVTGQDYKRIFFHYALLYL